MGKRFGSALLVGAVALALAGGAAAARSGSGNAVHAAFFANWDRYGRGYFVNEIPADKLNVIDYAFAKPSELGTCALTDPWSDYQAPTWSGANAVNGIADDPNNLDWEYPGTDPGNGAHFSPADKMNATALLQEFRRQLDAVDKKLLLTVDIAGGNIHSTGSWQLQQVAHIVDWIDMMSFDYHGGWDPLTDFNSPFGLDPLEPAVGGGALQWTWNTAGSVAYFLQNGVPPHKLVVGVPFYGKEYVGVGPTNNGLFQPHGAAPGNDSPTYHDLVDTGLADANLVPIGPTAVSRSGAGVNGFTRYFDAAAGAPWLYDPTLNGGTFVSYVDPGAVGERTALVDALGLRGVFAWEISNDDNAHDLAGALAGG